MGRKRKPTDTQRRVISISLKPTTILLMDEQISESTPRSQWIERAILAHLQRPPMGDDGVQYQILTHYDCEQCETRYTFKQSIGPIFNCKKCSITIQMSGQEKVVLE